MINLCDLIGSLHNLVTWYKIKHAGEPAAQRDFQNNAPNFVSKIQLHNLLTSMCEFEPCDQIVQKAN